MEVVDDRVFGESVGISLWGIRAFGDLTLYFMKFKITREKKEKEREKEVTQRSPKAFG